MIVVAGITRSGLTVMMQMLNAGGYPCVGKYPAFEEFPSGGWHMCEGKAVKLVDAQLQFPQTEIDYKIILLSRDLKQQAKSIDKVITTFFGVSLKPIPLLIKSLKKDYSEINKWASRHKTLKVTFEQIIKNPKEIACTLSEFVDFSLDIKKAVGIVFPRDPKCYPGFLELNMLERIGEEIPVEGG